MQPIGVGIIGAHPETLESVASVQIPALSALPEYELRAVSVSTRESAAGASRAFAIQAYCDHDRLLAEPGVDLVVVSARAPERHALIKAALQAGKMVSGEWPLAGSLLQSAELAAHARASGKRTVVGFAGRFSPAIRYARDLIAAGWIGEVLTTSLVASTGGTFGVPLLHALDTVVFVLGELASISSAISFSRSNVHAIDDGELSALDAAENVALSARLRSGTAVSVLCRPAVPSGEGLRWEVVGRNGVLILTAKSGFLPSADPELEFAAGVHHELHALPVPARYSALAPALSPGPVANLSALYAQFAHDVRLGSDATPDFVHAERHHRLLDAIEFAVRSRR
jgi:predicted dehydrogenase